jgi:surface antigen
MPESIWNSPLVSSRVETLDHTKGWAKQKETISADPDGLTFSHYKTGAKKDLTAQFDATLRSLPYQHGFTPVAWIGNGNFEEGRGVGCQKNAHHSVDECRIQYK